MESNNADIAVDLLKDPYADHQLKSRAKSTSVNAPIVFVKQTKIAAISIPYNLFKHEVGNISDEVAIVKGAITIVISSSDVK